MVESDIRKPFVHGRFYTDNPDVLRKQLQELADGLTHITQVVPELVIGGVVPHAGYIYSGKHAMALMEAIRRCNVETVVVVSPSHTGRGPAVSLDAHSGWETPFGVISADIELQQSGLFELSLDAQLREHAAEVILPMLQFTFKNPFKVAVITLREQNYVNACFVAQQLDAFRKQSGKKLLVIASSDFNHFESPGLGYDKDDLVLEKIVSFKTAEVEEVVKKYRVSVCGYGPIMALMEYSRKADTKPAVRIISRGHSGQVMPSNEVVDYISILFYKSS